MPIDLSQVDEKLYEEIYVFETFINQKSNEGKVLMCSVEKKGNDNQGYTYTHKLSLLQNDQKLLKKSIISATEYIQFLS